MFVSGVFKDDDGSIKVVSNFDNKNILEMTFLVNKEYEDVICVPTHFFCNLKCKMCHLTNPKLKKEMIPIYIDEFMESLDRTIEIGRKVSKSNKKSLLISFMGVGEPLLNQKLIKDVARKITWIKKIYKYSHVGLAISTMFPNVPIKDLFEFINGTNTPMKIHFSLHSPIEEVRQGLIPSSYNKIPEILSALNIYATGISYNTAIMMEHAFLHRTNRLTEIHYTLIKDVNDTDEELEELIKLAKEYKISVKFIKFNPKDDMEISQKEKKWVKALEKAGVYVKTYTPPGKNIGASCGEFTKHYYHKEIETEKQYKEFVEWKNKYEINID